MYNISSSDLAEFMGTTPSMLYNFTKDLDLGKEPYSIIVKCKRYYSLEAVIKILEDRGMHHPNYWLAFINLKGGVGKTTLALAVAYYLASRGGRVLVVDLDPQSNSTNTLIERTPKMPTMADIIMERATASEAIVKSRLGIDVIPSKLGDTSLEQVLLHQVAQSPKAHKDLFRKVFAEISGNYNYVIFDAPPSMGRPVYLAASCCDVIVIPVVPDKWAVEGLALTIGSIRDAEEAYGKKLNLRAVINRFDAREGKSKQFINDIQATASSILMGSVVRTNSPFKDIQTGNFQTSIDNKKNSSSHDIRDLVHELIPLNNLKKEKNIQ